MKVTMLLADFVQVSSGKLTAVGAGWTIINGGERAAPFGIALIFRVPWDRANERHPFRLRLLTEDGEPVMLQSAPELASEPFVLEGYVEVGRPPGVPRGTDLQSVLGVNLGPLRLPEGLGYVFRLEVVGMDVVEDCPFRTRPGEPR